MPDMSDVMRAFAFNLAKIRKARHLTQEQLSELSDLSITTIALYEGGKRQPTDKNRKKLARVLKCSELSFYAEISQEIDNEALPILDRTQLKSLVSVDLALEVLASASKKELDLARKFIPPELALEVLKKALKIKDKPRLI
jgi:transcriptional regulator with XRE-family HTH domain